MTDESAFHAALDAAIATGDANRIGSIRCVFADWLEDQGETDAAAGQRWMAENGKWPSASTGIGPYWSGIPQEEEEKHAQKNPLLMARCLPEQLHHELRKHAIKLTGRELYFQFSTRRAAEAALCKALAVLAKPKCKICDGKGWFIYGPMCTKVSCDCAKCKRCFGTGMIQAKDHSHWNHCPDCTGNVTA